MKQTPVCPGCYAPVEPSAVDCPLCGLEFEKPIFRAPPTVQMKARGRMRWIWVLAGVPVILGCSGFLSVLVLAVNVQMSDSEELLGSIETLPWSITAGFFLGGLLVARVSKGSTIIEPALSGMLSSAGVVLMMGVARPSQILIWAALSIPLALLAAVGAFLGELMQKRSKKRKFPGGRR